MRIVAKESLYRILFLIPVIFSLSCQKEESTIPILKTSPVSQILLTSVVSGGEIVSDGGESIMSKGLCWSLSENPTIDDFKSEQGSGSESFSGTLSGLSENTIYFVRAYASNSLGIAYGEQIEFLTGAVTDIEGNVYRIIEIGDQIWMMDNLKTSKYNDGADIPIVTDDLAWSDLSTAAYCWSDNDEETYKDTYGALYNYYAVNSGKLCPDGWHIPTMEECYTLFDYFFGTDVAGLALKEEGTDHWASPNTDANNESGFTALPGKFRSNEDGSFARFGFFAYWWMMEESDYSPDFAWTMSLIYNTGKVTVEPNHKGSGLYVRCIKNETVL